MIGVAIIPVRTGGRFWAGLRKTDYGAENVWLLGRMGMYLSGD